MKLDIVKEERQQRRERKERELGLMATSAWILIDEIGRQERS